MPEDFLHYLWNHRLFYPSGLTTTHGLPVEVIHPGWPNNHAGPDFFNARIRIDGTLWAGNVEIHLQSADWYRHGHQADAAYNNVVLHVVAQADRNDIQTIAGRTIPQLVLAYPPYLLENYNALLHHNGAIKCSNNLNQMPPLLFTQWLDRMAVEKMELRSEKISQLYHLLKGDWDQVAFVLLARAMGFGANADPMERVARSVPVRFLLRHSAQPAQLEALLLGQSGLLMPVAEADDYTRLLYREYRMLRQKYRLTPLDPSIWKYLRMRPSNFPDTRLAQLAALLAAIPGNFETRLLHPFPSNSHPFNHIQTSDYWKTHYRLGVSGEARRNQNPGKLSQQLLTINASIPFLFALASRRNDAELKEKVMLIWQQIPREHNSVLDQWELSGIIPADEPQAQGLLHLTKNYCIPGKCLHCQIGHALIHTAARPV